MVYEMSDGEGRGGEMVGRRQELKGEEFSRELQAL